MKIFTKAVLLLTAVASVISCSTTRVLQDGEYRLAGNKIEVVNDDDFNTHSLSPYLKQKHQGWSPFLNVYNWSNGKGGAWDRFVRKIGIAPVIYDPQMVDSSIESIDNHLEYLGYYGSNTQSEISVKGKKVTVIYKVNLGKQIPIRDIEISLPQRGEFAEAFLSDTASMSVKPGNFLSESSLRCV